MLSYGISNLRRLKSIPPIPIRPITILVGKNSSGKSSYLRSLPLLNQSITTNTAGAILWWGDYVDFGSFKETFHYRSPEKEIVFRFNLSALDLRELRHSLLYSRSVYYSNSPAITELRDVEIAIGVSNHALEKNTESNISYVSSYSITCNPENLALSFQFSEAGNIVTAAIGGVDILSELADKDARISLNSLLPTFIYRDSRLPYAVAVDDAKLNALVKATATIIGNFYSKKTGATRLAELANAFLNSWAFTPEALASLKTKTTDEEIRTLCGRIEDRGTDEQFADLSRYAIIQILPSLTALIAQKLSAIISSVSYIGPARVRSERYYRQQDLSVSAISPDGNNFPIFLASLTKPQIEEFSGIVYQLYGYKLRLKKEAGHISIFLDDDGFQINLIDTGYGLSQILPVIGQMWWSGRSQLARNSFASRNVERIVAIEQPELHLHPAHQATLADSFVLFSKAEQKTNRNQLHFLVETHSETLINRLGELIYEKKVSKDDVQIVVFEDDEKQKYTTRVLIATFNDDGSLNNWPTGFFASK